MKWVRVVVKENELQAMSLWNILCDFWQITEQVISPISGIYHTGQQSLQQEGRDLSRNETDQ